MAAPNERRASGAIFALQIGLVAWQPKAAKWIAEAIEAESPGAPDQAAPVSLAAAPMRRPIGPDAWVQIIESRK
jgi:hypothetical protein